MRLLLPEPPRWHCHEPISELPAPRDRPPEFYNTQKLNFIQKWTLLKLLR